MKYLYFTKFFIYKDIYHLNLRLQVQAKNVIKTCERVTTCIT